MTIHIRPATSSDTTAISRLILSALRTSNAIDYPASVIARVEQSFTPEAIMTLMSQRRMFVAVAGQAVLGTASLDGRAVRSVFVDPEWHRQGIGRLLMAEVERVARENGVACLVVPSSLTAQAFYAALGFEVVREQREGEERTLIMGRRLSV
ncbi:GCN5-related N-acetyltransferase [Pseudomonas syringae pv. philadelphi]|uniref:GCN5-related N-acetyltransferase n=1 Tax=Pseudomonas syringae pv. philadelphi TaxID=251706 RepID=A0A3M3Z6H5_9PSED|nr:GNAT family N-acetyltransferase [Pseudomonas syringae group genomosp. 3]RMO90196.1 GCN5-related N-acetyltransferase [Pseudomonas syringae pv. philadelphi]